MATNPKATLSKLLGATTIQDHEEILRSANNVLKASRKDQHAHHSRIVALLKLDRFSDALRALDECGDELVEKCALEKAYALYKTGELEEAEAIVSGCASSSPRGLKHVAAQIAYRAERFGDAAAIYKELSNQDASIEGEENDLRINSLATDVQLEWQGNGDMVEKSRKKPSREDLEAFETAYNSACGYIAQGKLELGSILLKQARDLCEALDELTEEEKKVEILPIMVQQAYTHSRLGNTKEADSLLKLIYLAEISEAPTRVVAQNNIFAAAAQDANPYLTERRLGLLPPLSKTERLFGHQTSIVQKNQRTMALKMLKFDGVERSTAKALKNKPVPSISPEVNILSVLNAAAHLHCENTKHSASQLLEFLEKRPGDVGLILTIIQFYVLTNNATAALAILESFFRRLEHAGSIEEQDVRYAPGLIAVAVSLFRMQGRIAPIQAELRKAASYWRRKSKPSESLYKAAGVSLLESSDVENLQAASEIFDGLRKQDANDRFAIAGYIASKATTDPSAVAEDLDKLSPAARLVAGIDTSSLENRGIASLPITMSETSKKRPAPIETEKPKKKRTIKLPKNYEHGKKVDPERWLPLKDRSSYKPKGRKGKKKALDSTQGGAVKDDESLELVGGAGAVKVEKAPAGVSKAKKKKGKK